MLSLIDGNLKENFGFKTVDPIFLSPTVCLNDRDAHLPGNCDPWFSPLP